MQTLITKELSGGMDQKIKKEEEKPPPMLEAVADTQLRMTPNYEYGLTTFEAWEYLKCEYSWL